MDDGNRRSRADIAAEAVGERDRSATPAEAKQRAEMVPDEAVRRIAPSAGALASGAEKTAEAVGERVADAYADPPRAELRKGVRRAANPAAAAASGPANDILAAGRQAAQVVSRQFDEQPFLMVVAGFALGYIAGSLLHGR